MLKVLSFCLAFSLYTLQVKSQEEEYSWISYDGTVPSDAMLASEDPEKKVLVGLALIKEVNCTGTLLENQTEMMAECYGKHKVKKDLKVLTVKDKTKFQWVKTSKKTFSEDLKDKGKPVEMGTNKNGKEKWFVGRITTEDGSIEVGHIGGGIMYFIHNNRQEKKYGDYEVLILMKDEEPKEAPQESTLAPEEPTPEPEEPTPAPDEPSPPESQSSCDKDLVKAAAGVTQNVEVDGNVATKVVPKCASKGAANQVAGALTGVVKGLTEKKS